MPADAVAAERPPTVQRMESVVVTLTPASETATPPRVSCRSAASKPDTALLNCTITADTDVVRGSGETSITSAVGAGCAGGSPPPPPPPPTAARAAAALTSPPVATLPARAGSGTAVERIAVRICAAVACGFAAASSATVPVTWGVAIEVPL